MAGGAIAAGLTVHCLPKKMNPTAKWLLGVAAGCASEAIDKNWDNKDLAECGAGVLIGASVITVSF